MALPQRVTPTIEEWVDTADQPWERHPDETDLQWEAFLIYREMGPTRTQTATADTLDKQLSLIGRWARENLWGIRATRYDIWIDEVYKAELVAQTRSMAKRHTEMAAKALDVLTMPLQHLLEKDPAELSEELSSKDILQLLQIAQASARTLPSVMGAERLSVGLPTEVSASQHTEIHVDANPDRLSAILEAAGPDLLNALMGEGSAGEIVDAEVIEVHPDQPASKTDDLPDRPTD